MATLEENAGSDPEQAAHGLYGALENIRDIGLAIRRPDDTQYQDELGEIASSLAYEGEFIINETAIQKGVYFFPKYLNETIQDYPEDGAENAWVPSTVRSHGQ